VGERFVRMGRLRPPGGGALIGSACIVVSLATYVSAENRVVFDRWSYPFVAVLLSATGLWAGSVIAVWHRHRQGPRQRGGGTWIGVTLNLAALAWGVGYLISSVDQRANAARLLDLNLVGSVAPAAAVLEWLAMALALAGVVGLVGRRISPVWINTSLATAAVCFTLLAGEGVARIKAIAAPETQGFPTYSSDVWARRYVRHNSAGFRDLDHSLHKPERVRRLLVVGDSFAFGSGIQQVEYRLGEQVSGRLTRHLGDPWESLNASAGDTHTLHHIEFARRMLPYDPDMVILLYVFNDIDYLRPVTPRDRLVEASRGVWDRLRPGSVLFKNSYLVQELYVRLRLARLRARSSSGDAADPYSDPTAVREHLADLARFVALSRSGGAIVAIVPFDISLAQEPRLQERYLTFVEHAHRTGLPVWSLAGVFGGREFRSLTVNRLDGHPNPFANGLAADAIWGLVKQAVDRAASCRESRPEMPTRLDSGPGTSRRAEVSCEQRRSSRTQVQETAGERVYSRQRLR
jgi:hypothetical protein